MSRAPGALVTHECDVAFFQFADLFFGYTMSRLVRPTRDTAIWTATDMLS